MTPRAAETDADDVRSNFGGAPTPHHDDDDDDDNALRDDGFGGPIGGQPTPANASDLMSAGGLFEAPGLFEEPSLDVTDKTPSMAPMSARSMSEHGGANDDFAPPSVHDSSVHSPMRPGTPPAVARAAASVVQDEPVLDETPMPPTPAGSEAGGPNAVLQVVLPTHSALSPPKSLMVFLETST